MGRLWQTFKFLSRLKTKIILRSHARVINKTHALSSTQQSSRVHSTLFRTIKSQLNLFSVMRLAKRQNTLRELRSGLYRASQQASWVIPMSLIANWLGLCGPSQACLEEPRLLTINFGKKQSQASFLCGLRSQIQKPRSPTFKLEWRMSSGFKREM